MSAPVHDDNEAFEIRSRALQELLVHFAPHPDPEVIAAPYAHGCRARRGDRAASGGIAELNMVAVEGGIAALRWSTATSFQASVGAARVKAGPFGSMPASSSLAALVDDVLHPSEELPMADTPPAPIAGVVVDATGQPVPGAQVRVLEPMFLAAEQELSLWDAERPITLAQTTTGPAGTFRLETPAPGLWHVHVSSPGMAPLRQDLAAPAQDVRFVLGAGASLELEVLDEQAQPVPRCEVALWAERPGSTDFLLRLVGDEAGRAAVRGLAAGAYLLVALPPRGAFFRYVTQPLELGLGEARNVRLQFEEGPHLQGLVVDSKGHPLPEVTVEVWADSLPSSWRWQFPSLDDREEKEALPPELPLLERLEEGYVLRQEHTTDAQGRFTVRHRLPRLHEVRCTQVGYVQLTCSVSAYDSEKTEPELYGLRVPAGQPECRIVLSYRGQVSGRVVGPKGQPVTSFTVDSTPFTHPDGCFRVTQSLEFPRLELTAPGFVGQRWEYDPQPGADLELGERVLEEARALRVRVLDAESSLPLPGAHLSVLDLERGETLEPWEHGAGGYPQTQKEGTCLLPTAPRRPLTVTAELAGYEEASAGVSQEEQELTLSLRRRGLEPRSREA
jgi:protocatechuate 3,4-dioxygenase beta subunit